MYCNCQPSCINYYVTEAVKRNRWSYAKDYIYIPTCNQFVGLALRELLILGPEPLMFWVIPHHHFLNVYLGKVLTTFYSVARGGSLQTMAV